MTKRVRPEEWAEVASEEVEGSNESNLETATATAEAKAITVGPPVEEGKVGTPEDVAVEHVDSNEMPGDGPFWELLALAGYKPW